MALAQRRQSQKQNTRAFGAPAPIKGLQAYDGVYNSDADGMTKAIWLFNLVPSELGCRVRTGSLEIAANLPGQTEQPGEVRTVAYYNSQVSEASGGEDFLFAMTDAGVFDITAGGVGPWVPSLAWALPGGDAGWCEHKNFTNVAGDHFLLVFDEVNGYWIFDGTAWRQPTGFQQADPDPEEIVQGVEWQGRMWFVQRDSTNAWYTKTAGGIEGDLKQLNMGSRFFRGGHLVQLAVWTVDDGAGMDDKLVSISSAGDVIVWGLSGTFNPDNASDLRVEGRWQIGKTPEGRRVLSSFGGDVVILSSFGVMKLSALLGGLASLDDESYVTKPVNRFLRNDMLNRIDVYGWQMELDQADGIFLITRPNISGVDDGDDIQYVLNVNTGAWSMYRGLMMLCMNKNNLGMLFGTRDGRVMHNTGSADDVAQASAPYTYPWTFEGEGDGPPPVGEYNYSIAQTTLRISQTDGNAVDRTTQLLLTPTGSIFIITDTVDPLKSITFIVTDEPNDSGDYITYAVEKTAEGANGPPLPGDVADIGSTPTIPPAKTIIYSLLTHYTHLGEPASWKRGQFVRPSLVGQSQPVYGIQLRYDFDVAEVDTNPPYLSSDVAKWDEAIWNLAKWGGSAQSYISVSGLQGMGRHIAIAMRGETADRLSLIGFDVMVDGGGML